MEVAMNDSCQEGDSLTYQAADAVRWANLEWAYSIMEVMVHHSNYMAWKKATRMLFPGESLYMDIIVFLTRKFLQEFFATA
jgi:hypothetical protein